MNLPPILEQSYLDNPLWRWLLVPLIVAAVMLLLRVLRGIATRTFRRWAGKTDIVIDDLVVDLVEKTNPFLLFFIALYIGLQVVTLPPDTDRIFGAVAMVSLLIQLGLWLSKVMRFAIGHYVTRDGVDRGDESTITTLSLIGQSVLWVLVVMLALDNVPGVEITSLIAGLGITGVAAALAVQNILGDLFASLAILLDKPFVIGDYIVVDDLKGTVEDIGLKTTRVRSLYGEELVFSNSDLVNSRLHNYKEMKERLVIFKIGVLYETPREKLKMIPDMIRESIQVHPEVSLDRSHLAEMGDSALIFETIYRVLDPDYSLYMDIQQAIIYDLLEKFEEAGIMTAYPTQTLYINHAPEN
ncbi:MAG: mechanosensitive ion channel family protein [Anaerolineae bacterium]|nr:mechanosensitive ion channel family protein [Anaerolineae bacterium]